MSGQGKWLVVAMDELPAERDFILTAHRQLLGRLLEEVDRRFEAESALKARRREIVRACLAFFADAPQEARLLTVDIHAAGPEGAERHDALVEALAERLQSDDGRAESAFVGHSEWMRVAGMLSLIGHLVLSGEADGLLALEDELVAAVSPGS